MFKVRATILLLSLAIFQIASGQNREILGEYKIGIIGQDREDATYQATFQGAKEAALELSRRDSIDIELVMLTPDTSQGGDQQTSLGQLFIDDADGFIISPDGSDSVRSAVKFAQEQGQEVVFFETAIEGIEPLTAIIADEFEAGKLAGQTMLKRLPSKGRVALLINEDPGPAMLARLDGVRTAMGYKRIQTIVSCQPDYQSAVDAIRQAEEADRNDLIRGWIFLDGWPLLGMPALPWKPNERPCLAIHSSPSALMYLDLGYVDAMVVHSYYDWGRRSVEALIGKLHQQITPAERLIKTPPRLIDWQNLEAYRNSWKAWLQ